MLKSPLRYPGGKAKLLHYFAELISINSLFGCNYCEPYAGGAGLALKLLSGGFVGQVTLNDIDPCIWSFWTAVLNNNEAFCQMVEAVPLTIEEWHQQKLIWSEQDKRNPLRLGFATYYLNRTNRSGIIEGAGPVGGYDQKGQWRLDARFVKEKQISGIQNLSHFSNRIFLSNMDALDFLDLSLNAEEGFTYLDPPYYVKGSKLYRNFYQHSDHCDILELIDEHRDAKWVVSYDDVPQIREIYRNFQPIPYGLSYSAGQAANGREVIFLSDALQAPEMEVFSVKAA
jgi:DNA adenine methylase